MLAATNSVTTSVGFSLAKVSTPLRLMPGCWVIKRCGDLVWLMNQPDRKLRGDWRGWNCTIRLWPIARHSHRRQNPQGGWQSSQDPFWFGSPVRCEDPISRRVVMPSERSELRSISATTPRIANQRPGETAQVETARHD